jgi:hypothetical protein
MRKDVVRKGVSMICQIDELGSLKIGDHGVYEDDRGRPHLHLTLTLADPSRDAFIENKGIGYAFLIRNNRCHGRARVAESRLPLSPRALHAIRRIMTAMSFICGVVFDLMTEHQVEIYLRFHSSTRITDPNATLCRVAREVERAWKEYPLLSEREKHVGLWQ